MQSKSTSGNAGLCHSARNIWKIYGNHKDCILQASCMINTSHFILKWSSGGHVIQAEHTHSWTVRATGAYMKVLKNANLTIKQVCSVCHPLSVRQHQEPLQCVAPKCYLCSVFCLTVYICRMYCSLCGFLWTINSTEFKVSSCTKHVVEISDHNFRPPFYNTFVGSVKSFLITAIQFGPIVVSIAI